MVLKGQDIGSQDDFRSSPSDEAILDSVEEIPPCEG